MERFWLPPLKIFYHLRSLIIAREHTIYDRASFSLMCLYMGGGTDPVNLPTPAVKKPIELWTGKQLCSVLVCPNDTKTEDGRETEAMCTNDGFSYFCKSEMLSGHLGKGTSGSGNKDGLFSVLHREHKTHVAASCMDRVARMRRPERLVGSDFSADIHDLDDEYGTTNLAYSNGVCTFVYVDSGWTFEKDPVQYRDRAFKYMDFGGILPNIVGTRCGNVGASRDLETAIREKFDGTGSASIEAVAEFAFDFLKAKANDDDLHKISAQFKTLSM